jgi:hypothetical protein
LHPDQFDPSIRIYLESTRSASDFGYSVTFIAVTVLSLIGALAVGLLVRKAPTQQQQSAANMDRTG